jgi:WD40 repeat protein
MGEVWLARDLKLQVELALKVVRPDRLGDEGALARLRAEVLSARAVASPHVCQVYDLVEAEGLECVSMEYVDGTTLRQVLDTRTPLELSKAREIALQLLEGLGAIHEAGLVHRDVKPENIMLTRAGRVVLMDFGIAKAAASGGDVAGTPAYWAPEQATGAPADPRADVFAAGLVLAEMVAPSGVRQYERRQALLQALREDPPNWPETPWSEAIRKAVAREPDQRYPSAQALARALEEIAHRVTGIEEAQPYPGLSSFTEAEAEYFFGREAEVEEAWKRLPQRHLLALVGPSGAGKSSFLRAGLVPAKPEGWAHLVCTPGDAPFVALGQALVPEVSRGTDAMRQMLRFEDADVAVELFRRWRSGHEEALVIVDQLEELFTLNPPGVQARFASLLSRLVLEADVRVLLAMRDDFLFRCQEHEALRPVFEGLLPLGPPAGESLRRALVQPALKCGYRFEDETLVTVMLQAVEGERGALPLLAFAAASLWTRRDRENGLLTRAAYEAIGGVGGALAQHAEATLDRIGPKRLSLAREMFRNLVTAEGTRAVRDVEELLTVFPEDERPAAETVLRALIDARLLTSYEAHATEPGQRSGRQVEVVHESLINAWPRLVRWRTEDEGGAQLRDQLRQAAHLWQGKGKTADLLWTGTSFQEYQVWRSRYPGGLSEVEEAFGTAMTERVRGQRRRRRTAYGVLLAAVVMVAAGLGTMWRRSVRETRRAEAEAARAEAGRLLSLGRLNLADAPNVALAYAMASLEQSDSDSARRFALETLWKGPPALFLAVSPSISLDWGPDGRWLAQSDTKGVLLRDRDSNNSLRLGATSEVIVGITSDGRRLVSKDVTVTLGTVLNVWALPEGRLERTLRLEQEVREFLNDDRVVTFAFDSMKPTEETPATVRRLSLDGRTQEVLGRWEPHGLKGFDVDPTGTWIFSVQRGRVLQQRLDALSAPGRLLGTHEGEKVGVRARPWKGRVVTSDSGGNVRIWNTTTGRLDRLLKSPADAGLVALEPGGRFLATRPGDGTEPGHSVFLFDLGAPRSAEPVSLLDSQEIQIYGMCFSPDGSWLASSKSSWITFWNLSSPRSTVLGRQRPPGVLVKFTRDGHLISVSGDDFLRRWPLSPAPGDDVRELYRSGFWTWLFEEDPAGRFAVVAPIFSGEIDVVPLDGSPRSVRSLKPRQGANLLPFAGSLSADGRFLAITLMHMNYVDLSEIRILDLSTGTERALDTHPKVGEGCWDKGDQNQGGASPLWLPDGRFLSDGDAGLRIWNLEAGTSEQLRPCRKLKTHVPSLLATPDSHMVLSLARASTQGAESSLSAFDLGSRVTREITSHGKKLWSLALDPQGTTLVTGDSDGVIRVGPLTGEEPHLLIGHTGRVMSVAVSPDGRTIASGSNDGTIRLWPMPDLSKPPLHTLPHDELLAKLKSLTNLRAVRDPASDTGWKIEIGPFPGWKDVPTWQP